LPQLEEQIAFNEFVQQTDKSKFVSFKSQFIERFDYIPEEQYVPLNDVCNLITDGTHNPPKFVDSGIPFLLVSNITGNVITYDTTKYITEETYGALMKRTPIEVGDVLLSTVGSYGHPAIVTEEKKFSFQRHIAHLKPNRELINSQYLHTVILSDDVQRQIEQLVLGVAQKTLNLAAIKSIKIPLPQLEEQIAFNEFVQQTDKSKFELKEAIKKLEKAQAKFVSENC
jgi:type I restriction enzyme S subunit